MSARPLVAVLILVAAATAPLIARQTTKTTVEFKVIDVQGAAIRGATIRITPNPDSTRLSFETDHNGTRVVNAGPGDYSLSVTRSGFARYSSTLKISEGDSPQAVRVEMKVGSTGSPWNIAPSPPADQLRVEHAYFPGEAAVLTPDDLQLLPHISITVRNPDTNQAEKYSGVSLLEVLIRAGALSSQDLGLLSRSGYVVLKGNGDSGCVIALSEIDPSNSSNTVLVADALNGQPFTEGLGPLRLIFANDKTFARSIRILNSIRVDFAR